MIERFKRYLEREFRTISPTRVAMEYREEVLSTLLDRAQEYRIKGMTDEDMIYDLCIDSLGDFRSTLQDFESKTAKIKKTVKKAGAIALVYAAVALLFVVGYLVLSLVTHAWDKTWLVLVGGAFLGVISAAIIGIISAGRKKRHFLIRFCMALIIVLLFVYVFLILQIIISMPYSWILFLIMAIAVVGADTVYAILSANKLWLLEFMFCVEVMFSLVYVILGVTNTVPWHPYWLLPVVGAFVDICAAVIAVISFKRKKEKQLKEKISERFDVPNEEYYTKWKD